MSRTQCHAAPGTYRSRQYRAHLDDRDAALLHLCDRLLEHARELGRIEDRAFGPGAVAARDGGVVDVGIDHALADPGIFERPVAILGDVHLVLLVIAPGG